jgi:ABC-type phosphate/phosphonate transport system substrate-binding protein
MTDQGRHFLASTGRQFFVKAEDADYNIVRAYARRLQLAE